MNTKKNRKMLSLLLITVMAITLLFQVFASANSFTIAVGGSEAFSITGSNITNITSSNTNVATVGSSSGTSVLVYGVAAGTATLNVSHTNISTGVGATMTVAVTVSQTGASSTTLPTITIAAAQTSNIGSFTSLNAYNSSNASVATVSYLNNILSVTGITAGSTIVTYTQLGTNGINVTYTVPVNVTSTGIATTTRTSDFDMKTGQQAASGTFSSISAAKSTDESVATVEIKNNQLIITAKVAGTAIINYTAVPLNGTSATTGSYSIKVTGTTGSGTAGSGTTASGAGIELNSYTRNVKVGKKYKLTGIKLNGVSVNAADLLWVSSDSDLATISDKTGIFKANEIGEAKVIAVSPDGEHVRAITLKITK